MLALYQKYRPTKFSEVAGQEHVVKTLTNAIAHQRVGHAYLFTGPRGTGKTSLARLFAKTINCLKPQKSKGASAAKLEPCNRCSNCKLILENKSLDLIELDAASHTGVDNIRQLRESVPLPPSALKFKVYIIDEVHMLSIGAFNALLKTLEEPPEHAIFILATTELHKVPETIISRCQRFDISLLTQPQIVNYLATISKKEKVEIETEALETIALEAEGGMRDAQSILGQIIALEDKTITAQEVNNILGTSSKKVVIDFIELLTKKASVEALEKIEKLQQEGINLRNFNKNILAFLRILLLLKTSTEAGKKSTISLAKEQLQQALAIAQQFALADILALIELFQASLAQFKNTTIPQLPLELATVKHCSSEELAVSSSATPSPATPTIKKTTPPADSKKTTEKFAKNPATPAPINTPATSVTKPVESATKKAATIKPLASSAEEQPQTFPQRELSLTEIQDSWSTILEKIKPENRSIHAFLTNCTPCGVSQGTIYIKTKYDFYKDKLSETENRLTVQKTAATILNAAIKIAFVTERESLELNLTAQESKDENHNVLHEAMQVFGGKIIKD